MVTGDLYTLVSEYSSILQSLVQHDNNDINQKRSLVECICKQMWRELGHLNSRALILPFLLDQLDSDSIKLISPGHLILVITFLSEAWDICQGEVKLQGPLLNVCI